MKLLDQSISLSYLIFSSQNILQLTVEELDFYWLAQYLIGVILENEMLSLVNWKHYIELIEERLHIKSWTT